MFPLAGLFFVGWDPRKNAKATSGRFDIFLASRISSSNPNKKDPFVFKKEEMYAGSVP